MAHVNLEGIAEDAWDINPNFIDKIKAFKDECKKNWGFEWKCIAMCEAGDIVGTYASAATIAHNNSNEWGFALGVASGLAYAYNHTMNDAKERGVKPSFADAAIAAGTAEAGCVTAATAVAYYVGSKYGINFLDPVTIKEVLENWKLYGQDFAVRLSALPVALPIGLLVMSAFTFPKKSEVGRFVTSKEALYDVADFLREDYRVKDNRDRIAKFKGLITAENPTIMVYGNKSVLKIKEQKLPQIYQENFSQENDSLYRVFSPRAKYSEEARVSAEGLVCRAFSKIGMPNHAHVKNPFLHEHAHVH